MFSSQNPRGDYPHQHQNHEIFTHETKLSENQNEQSEEQYVHNGYADIQENQGQMQYQVSVQSNYIHVDQFGVPIENISQFSDNYSSLSNMNSSLQQAIEFSFDDPSEEHSSDNGSPENDAQVNSKRLPIARCDQCGVTFRSFSGLYHHQKTHEGQLYKCPENGCHKEYKTEHLLRRHLKVHRDHREGNLKCPHCEKTFCRADYLEIHIKRHLGQKDEKCPECGKGFVCKSDLIRHKLNVHSAYGRYQCPDCGKRLRSNTSLNRHRQSRLCIKQPFNYISPNSQQNGYIDDEEYTFEPQLDQESPLHTEGHRPVIVENSINITMVDQSPTLNSTLLGQHHDENSEFNLMSETDHSDIYISNQEMNSQDLGSPHKSVIQETSAYLNLNSNNQMHGSQNGILTNFSQMSNGYNHQSHLAYSDINYVPVTSSSTDFLSLPQQLQSITPSVQDDRLSQTLLQSI